MARKKKEIAPGVTKKTPKVDNLIVTEIVNVAHNRNRKDVGTLKSAIERAESVTIPNRYRLYDLYHDVVTIDGHLSGLLDKRTKSVTNKGLTFHDNSGKKVDELDSLINSPQFERFVEICMETLYWGTSAIEFIVGPNFSFEEIDRRHIRPEAREIATNMFDSKGISIDNLPQVMILGKKNDLGKLLQCSMYALYKRSGFGDFAQYVEIFGQPVRVVKYDAYDSETQKKLRQTLEESGSSLTIMIPKQADFEMLDGKTSNGNGELQKSLIEVCNQEMSIAILGNSETTTSSNSSGYAQAAVHQSQQLEITQSDLRYICNILNSEQFLNILTSYGYNVQGGSFCFDEEIDLQKLKSRLDIDIQLSNKVPISDDYWYETYGIPKPDNYDQLKQEQEERRQAVLEAIKSGEKDNDKGNTPNEPKDKENDPKKKSKLFDQLADFFGCRPLVGGDTIDEEYGINELPPLVEGDVSLSVEGIARALVNIYKGNVDIDHEVEEHLFQETSKIFNEAISEGYANAVENNTPLPNDTFRSSFKHSADVFSAFRVHRMQQDIAAQMIDEDGHVKPFQKFVKDVSPYIEHRNRAWLRTEYDTAILRAQNAAEWKMFEAEKDVYPNLEWIDSTSPNPGADHMVFWGTVRPVDDPFWDEHKPGDRWNCKCELQQSDSDVTAAPLSDGKSDPARGLESNPAKAEELFSQKHPYYPQSCMSCPFAGNKLMALAMDLAGRKNCNRCGKVDKEIGKRIDSSPNKKKAGEIEVSDFVKKHLEPSVTSSGQKTNQKLVTSKDGDELIFRRKFFDETLAKCCRKKNVGETMQFAFEFEQWAKKLTLVRTETGIHHDCDFRVYECTYQGKRIELKAKDTAGYISYMIRVYDK